MYGRRSMGNNQEMERCPVCNKPWKCTPKLSTMNQWTNKKTACFHKHAAKTKLWKTFNAMLQAAFLSLLSDSNQRPRDYKSRALANWAKEANGQATNVAPLNYATLASIKTWGIHEEQVALDLPDAKLDISWKLTKFFIHFFHILTLYFTPFPFKYHIQHI